MKITRLTLKVDAEDHFRVIRGFCDTGECDKYMQLYWTSNVARTTPPELPRKFGHFGMWRGTSHWTHSFYCELPDTNRHWMHIELVISSTNPLSRYAQPSIVWSGDGSVLRYGDVSFLSRWQDIYRDYDMTTMIPRNGGLSDRRFVVTLEPPAREELELFRLREKFEECSYA